MYIYPKIFSSYMWNNCYFTLNPFRMVHWFKSGLDISNHHCTWYSRTRWCYQQGSTFCITRPQSNRLGRVKVTSKIINILSKSFSERQINLLRRGLKFTPTSKRNTIELKSDNQEFIRMLQLTEFFRSENLDSSQETKESVFDPVEQK